MSIFTKEDKAAMANKGIDAGLQIFDELMASSRQQREKDLEDSKIDITEYNRVCAELEESLELIHNLLSDTELNSKLRKTEEIFVSIIRIIMFDLEYDHSEVFVNLNKFIDNDDFIDGHEKALEERKIRLEKEYQEELIEYEVQLKDYKVKLDHHNSKGFFKKLLSDTVIEPPTKPERRE